MHNFNPSDSLWQRKTDTHLGPTWAAYWVPGYPVLKKKSLQLLFYLGKQFEYLRATRDYGIVHMRVQTLVWISITFWVSMHLLKTKNKNLLTLSSKDRVNTVSPGRCKQINTNCDQSMNSTQCCQDSTGEHNSSVQRGQQKPSVKTIWDLNMSKKIF